MSMRRFVAFWTIVVVLLVGLTVFVLWPAQALTPTHLNQDATPTPLLNIPTATPPSVAPMTSLQDYGLQAQDLPALFIEEPDNAPLTPDQFLTTLLEDYPDKALFITTLDSLYRTYGVLGSDERVYFTEDCNGQSVFGLSTWIRQLPDSTNAQALFEDASLSEAYRGLFGWQPFTDDDTGQVYTTPIDTTGCTETSTEYILEYPIDEFLVAISVYALDTTDLTLVQALLANLQNIINQRIGKEVVDDELPVNIPIAIAETNINVRRGPSVTFDPPIGALLTGESAQIIALNLNDTWLKILFGEDRIGWVSADVVTIEGDISDLPRESGPIPPSILNNGQGAATNGANQAENTEGTSDQAYQSMQGQNTDQAPQPQQPTLPPQVTPTPCVPPFCTVDPPTFPTAIPTITATTPPLPTPRTNGNG